MKQILINVNDPLNILIIRLSSIGDILLSTPFIRQLRNFYKNARIEFVIKDIFSELVIDNPNLDTVHVLKQVNGKQNLKELKNQLSLSSYDIIFDLHNNFRSNYLKRRINAKYVRTIKKDKCKQFVLVYFKKDIYKTRLTIPDRYLALAADFEILDDQKGLEFFWKSDLEDKINKIAEEAGLNINRPYICLAPGAGFFTKRWPVEYFQELKQRIIEQFAFQVVILGDQNEKNLGRLLDGPGQIYDFTGKLSLTETGIVLSKSMALVSNDSGLMHMATAVNTPVVAIFGSTVKQLGFFPYRARSIVLENKTLQCRPCSHIGRKTCPKKHFDCMRKITPAEVFAGLRKLLE